MTGGFSGSRSVRVDITAVAAAPAPAAAEKVKPATGTVSERLFLSRDNHKDRRSETDLIFTTPVQNRSRSISEFTAHIIC